MSARKAPARLCDAHVIEWLYSEERAAARGIETAVFVLAERARQRLGSFKPADCA